MVDIPRPQAQLISPDIRWDQWQGAKDVRCQRQDGAKDPTPYGLKRLRDRSVGMTPMQTETTTP